jgi:Major Facilitator Superfamily
MHHIVKHHIHNAKYLERNRVYWAMSLKTFGVSLVGVFVPAYLYALGYSYSEILYYFLIRELIELACVIPTTYLMRFAGVRRTIILGTFLTVLQLALLIGLNSNPSLFLIAAVVEALAISMFFLPYHFIFSAAVTKKDGGKQLGLMDILLSIVAAIGPVVGGYIAEATNMQLVLLAASGLVLSAAIPLLKSKENNKIKKFSFIKTARLLPTKDSLSSAGMGITEMVATIIWPLFIYISVKNYAVMGLIISLSILFIIVLDMIVGKMSDNGKKGQLLQVGALGSVTTHGMRVFATTPIGIWVVTLLADIMHTMFRIPWTVECYRRASIEDRASYIAAIELSMCFGRVILWVLLLILAGTLSDANLLIAAFAIGALGSLFVPMIYKPVGSARKT